MDKQNRILAVAALTLTLAACGRSNMNSAAHASGFAPVGPTIEKPPGDGGSGASLPASFAPPVEPAVPAAKAPALPVSTQPPVRPNLKNQGATFAALQEGSPQEDYLKRFEPSGRPRFQFQSRLEKELKRRLDQPEALSSKAERVMAEMQRVANREASSDRALLLIPDEEAKKWSLELERSGQSPKAGAWSIAVKQTAVRHRFPGVPCAEFVSEVVREAYARAEVDIKDDFSSTRGNRLIWSETASVAGLKRALLKAGWVPWNAHAYVPPIGAIMMNGTGETPGHAFLAAGHSGRYIVDNGSPQGRDLGATSLKILKEMYSAGVFFLPPGVNPSRWR